MKRLQELTSITESYVSPAFEKSITGWWVVTHHNGKLKCVSFGPYTKKHVAEREAKQTGFDVAYGKRNSKGFLVPLSNQEPDLHTTRVQESIKPRWIVNVKRSDGQVEEKKVRASSVEAIKKHYGENFVSAEPADEDLEEALRADDERLLAIAKEHFKVDSFDQKDNDEADFHDHIAIWSIKYALKEAYDLGLADGKKGEQ